MKRFRILLEVPGMPRLTTLLSLALVTASIGSAQPVPPELSALIGKARLALPVAGWCRGEFRAGHAGGYAVAVPSAAGGRYLVVGLDATVVELVSYTGRPDLSCYTPAEARKLHLTIGQSDTIHGAISPRWGTTVVCAFVDDTTSICWQYSPADHGFIKVGGWVT